MTEFVTKPVAANANVDNLDWANATPGGLGVDVIEPGSGVRDVGYPFEGTVPYQTLNWVKHVLGLLAAWLISSNIRAFDSLETGSIGQVSGLLFQVGKRSAITTPWTSVWDITAGATVNAVHSDCEFIWYAEGDSIFKLNRLDGSLASGTNTRDLGATVRDIWSDGFLLFAVTDTNGGTEAFVMNRGDLTDFLGPFGASGGGSCIESNGLHFVVIDTGFTPNVRLEATGALLGVLSYGATPTACAMDYSQTYIIGPDAGGGVQVKAFKTSAVLSVWSKPIPGAAGAAVLRDVVADGEFVWVCGDSFDDDGVPATLWCFERTTGLLVYRLETPGNVCEHLALDERYVYISDDDRKVYVYTKSVGSFVHQFEHSGVINGIDSDADALFVAGAAGTGGFRVRRVDRGNGTKLYSTVGRADPNRRPFAKVSVPAEW